MWDKLAIARLKFQAVAEEEIDFPTFAGGALRGGFGAVLKRVCCVVRDKECRDCLLISRCIYYYIFEGGPAKEGRIYRTLSSIPRPFVLEPPLGLNSLQAGEPFSFHLILFGKAIEHLPFLILTINELGRVGMGRGRGRFRLSSVSAYDGFGSLHPIYLPASDRMEGKPPIITFQDILRDASGRVGLKEVTLELLTPIRVKTGGHLTAHLNFPVLIGHLIRRQAQLFYFHCDQEPELDFKGLINSAKEIRTARSDTHWYEWRRYSGRQKSEMYLGGLIGTITYSGSLDEFLPFLILGQYTHVGKNATFGLGQYRLL